MGPEQSLFSLQMRIQGFQIRLNDWPPSQYPGTDSSLSQKRINLVYRPFLAGELLNYVYFAIDFSTASSFKLAK